jgi:GntR family transcriptional regulator
VPAAPQPRFHSVFREIATRIERGVLSPGDRLPSERWFGDDLGVSRTTVRRAIEELVATGLVEPRSGALYVAPGAAAAPANRLQSLTELARARGLEPTARVLLQRERAATLDEAELFRIAPGAALFELRRLRLLDGVAVAIDHDRVPLRLLPGAASLDFTTASLFGALEAAGSEPIQARLQIEARAATAEEAELLELAPAAPLLVATEHATDRAGALVNLGVTAYRSDRHRFLATFTRGPRLTRPEGGPRLPRPEGGTP